MCSSFWVAPHLIRKRPDLFWFGQAKLALKVKTVAGESAYWPGAEHIHRCLSFGSVVSSLVVCAIGCIFVSDVKLKQNVGFSNGVCIWTSTPLQNWQSNELWKRRTKSNVDMNNIKLNKTFLFLLSGLFLCSKIWSVLLTVQSKNPEQCPCLEVVHIHACYHLFIEMSK